MVTPQQRYRTTNRERFVQLLRTWLAELPRGGWTGTATELGNELEYFNHTRKCWALVPTRSELTKALLLLAPVLAAIGWKVSAKKTHAARLLTFSRTGTKNRGRAIPPIPALDAEAAHA